MAKVNPENNDDSIYISPKELAQRWQVSRNTALSIARQNGFTALFLGDKKKSTIRYKREEVIVFENSRSMKLHN